MFSTGASEGFILLVPTRLTEFHISSPVPSLSLRAKDHLEGTKVAVSPRYCAENKVQTGSAAAGGHRRSGDHGRRRSTWLPEEEQATQRRRAEWMKVLRYGHLRSAPVVVAAWLYARSGNRLHSVQPCGSPRAFDMGASSMAYCLSVEVHKHVVAGSNVYAVVSCFRMVHMDFADD